MRKLLIILLGVMLCSCTSRVVYSEFISLPIDGWDKDSVLRFEFEVSDTVAECDVHIYIRHTQKYPYQNMWLFIEKEQELEQSQDTIEFYLADERGRWLGNGYGNLKEMPVIYEQRKVFEKSGKHEYNIRQAMREDRLRGVSDVGIKIVKKE